MIQSGFELVDRATFQLSFVLAITFCLHVMEHLREGTSDFIVSESWLVRQRNLHFLEEARVKILLLVLQANALGKLIQMLRVGSIKISISIFNREITAKVESKDAFVVNLHENGQELQVFEEEARRQKKKIEADSR